MKNILLIVICFVFKQSYGQSQLNLTGKTFEYIDKRSQVTSAYTFLSNKSARLKILTELSGKIYEDNCTCKCEIDRNKISVNCECDDKEVYKEELKEVFLIDPQKKTLKTTIHLDINRNPLIYIQK